MLNHFLEGVVRVTHLKIFRIVLRGVLLLELGSIKWNTPQRGNFASSRGRNVAGVGYFQAVVGQFCGSFAIFEYIQSQQSVVLTQGGGFDTPLESEVGPLQETAVYFTICSLCILDFLRHCFQLWSTKR